MLLCLKDGALVDVVRFEKRRLLRATWCFPKFG